MQDSSLPLAGLRVIELHAIGPVPFIGMQLVRLGASVLRISPPFDPEIGIAPGQLPDPLHHNKRCQRLDLKKSADRQQLLSQLADTDVLLEGFRPGVLERLVSEIQPLQHRHPALVIGRLSGFGRRGPYAHLAGHDINYLALSGVLHAIGSPDKPSIPLNLIADFGGGAMHLLVGVLAALIRRSITGKGAVVDTSILAGTHGLTPMIHGMLADNAWHDARYSNLLDGGAPFYSVYRTRDDQHVAVGALEAKFYSNLVSALHLSDQLQQDKQYDQSTWPQQRECLSRAFAEHPREHWDAISQQVDCCLTPVLNWHEAVKYEHNVANAWFDNGPVHKQLVTFT